MTFYMLATIDDGGYIRTRQGYASTVHRESVFDYTAGTHFQNRDVAVVARRNDQFIVTVGEDGRACELWVMPEELDRVKDRLRIWSGCYGSWPVRTLNKEDA